MFSSEQKKKKSPKVEKSKIIEESKEEEGSKIKLLIKNYFLLGEPGIKEELSPINYSLKKLKLQKIEEDLKKKKAVEEFSPDQSAVGSKKVKFFNVLKI